MPIVPHDMGPTSSCPIGTTRLDTGGLPVTLLPPVLSLVGRYRACLPLCAELGWLTSVQTFLVEPFKPTHLAMTKSVLLSPFSPVAFPSPGVFHLFATGPQAKDEKKRFLKWDPLLNCHFYVFQGDNNIHYVDEEALKRDGYILDIIGNMWLPPPFYCKA